MRGVLGDLGVRRAAQRRDCIRVAPRLGVALEQRGGDLVDPLVGTLGRENRGHQQLQGAAVVQRPYFYPAPSRLVRYLCFFFIYTCRIQ